MNESEFARQVEKHLRQALPTAYEVRTAVNLQHSIIFNEEGVLWPSKIKALDPRKVYAYQADVVISKGEVPLVAVELKCGQGSGYTTHDVLTYSTKAARHKELYPYLRYGMAIGGAKSIGRKFFFTNRSLDFVTAVNDEAGFDRLARVVSSQARLAEDALRILDRENSPRVLSWQNGSPWEWAKQVGPDEDEEKD